jgi:hypothetical protein
LRHLTKEEQTRRSRDAMFTAIVKARGWMDQRPARRRHLVSAARLIRSLLVDHAAGEVIALYGEGDDAPAHPARRAARGDADEGSF